MTQRQREPGSLSAWHPILPVPASSPVLTGVWCEGGMARGSLRDGRRRRRHAGRRGPGLRLHVGRRVGHGGSPRLRVICRERARGGERGVPGSAALPLLMGIGPGAEGTLGDLRLACASLIPGAGRCGSRQDGSNPRPGQSSGSGDTAWCPICRQDGGDGDPNLVHLHNGGDGALCPAQTQGSGDRAGHRSAPARPALPHARGIAQPSDSEYFPAKPSLSHPGTLLPAVTCPCLGNPRLPANPLPSPAATRRAAVIPGWAYAQAVNRGFVTVGARWQQ